MNADPYYQTDRANEAAGEEADRRDAWEAEETERLVEQWREELQSKSGIIEALDYQHADVIATAVQLNISFDDALYKLANGYVVNNNLYEIHWN